MKKLMAFLIVVACLFAAWRLAPAAWPLYTLATQGRSALAEVGQRLQVDPYVMTQLGSLLLPIGALAVPALLALLFGRGYRRKLVIVMAWALVVGLKILLIDVYLQTQPWCVNLSTLARSRLADKSPRCPAGFVTETSAIRSYTETLKSRKPAKPCNLDVENETCSGVPVFDSGTGLPNVFEDASGQFYDAPGFGRDGSHLVPFTQAQLAQLRRVRQSLAAPAPQALPPSTAENADTAHPDGPAQNAQTGDLPQFLGTVRAASTNPEATTPIASLGPSESPVPATTPAAGPASSVAPPCPADSKQRPTPPADPTTADPVGLLSQSTPDDMWQRVAATCGQPQPRDNNSRAYWQWVDCRWRVYGRR